MKRKLLRIVLVLVVLLIMAGAAIYLWPQDRITEASWQKIRLGMSETDVEEILGRSGLKVEEGKQIYEDLKKQLGKEPFIREDILLAEPDTFGVLNDLPPRKVWLGRRRRPADATFLERLRDWLGW